MTLRCPGRSITDGLQERPFRVPWVYLCVVWMFLCRILMQSGMSCLVPLCLLECTSYNMHLSYNVYSICILCLTTNLFVTVSCNFILNGLMYFMDVLFICICDIVHREET